MSGFKLIEHTEWQPLIPPIWLFSFPFNADEFEHRSGVRLEENHVDGLGLMRTSIVKLDEYILYLECAAEGPRELSNVSVMVYAHEQDWDRIATLACGELNIEVDELPEVQSEIEPGKWVLSRLDDNDNEVEMFRFPLKEMADNAKRIYTERGHKQSYYVRKSE